MGMSFISRMACVAVAQRMGADPLPRRNRAQFLSAFHRRLHPAPGCRGMCLYDSALAEYPTFRKGSFLLLQEIR